MSSPILSREVVAEQLAVNQRILVRYETRGLVHPVREGEVEGYPPGEIRRLWTIVTLQRDLGVNLAGVEAILKLREHLASVHHEVEQLARRLREAVEADLDDADADE